MPKQEKNRTAPDAFKLNFNKAEPSCWIACRGYSAWGFPIPNFYPRKHHHFPHSILNAPTSGSSASSTALLFANESLRLTLEGFMDVCTVCTSHTMRHAQLLCQAVARSVGLLLVHPTDWKSEWVKVVKAWSTDWTGRLSSNRLWLRHLPSSSSLQYHASLTRQAIPSWTRYFPPNFETTLFIHLSIIDGLPESHFLALRTHGA